MDKYQIKRYFIVLALAIIVMLVAIPMMTADMLTRAYDDQIRDDINQTSFFIEKTVGSFINGMYSLCFELAVNPSLLTMDGGIQQPIIAASAARNDYIELLFITGTDGMQTARSEGMLGDRSERFWFQHIMEHKQPFVSHSYFSVYTNMPCTSMFIPMFDGSGKVGILGADINLRYIQGLAEQFTNFKSGRYAFIIDGEGIVIAHPDNLFLETLTNYKTLVRTVALTDAYGNAVLNPDGSVVTVEEEIVISDRYRAVIEAVMNGESGLEIVREGKTDYYMSYKPIVLPGYSDSWSVITIQDRSVAMSVIYQLVGQVLLLITLILFVLIFLVRIFYKSLNNTVNSLKNAMREADNRTRLMINTTPRMCLLFDSDFDVVDCNIMTTQFMGFATKEEALTGFIERLEEYTPESQSDGQPSVTIVNMLAVVAEKGEAQYETELHMDGQVRIVHTYMKKVPYEDSFAIVCYASDITERREKENELARAHELYEIQLANLNLVVKATKIGRWEMEVVKDDQGNPVNVFTWSDDFRHMLGYTDVNDFPNTKNSWIDCLYPEDKDTILEAFEKHIMDKTGRIHYDIEYRMIKKDGTYGYYRDTGETIRDKNGDPVYVAGAMLDMTETKNLIDEIEHQRVEAEAANKAKSEFLSTMSHEIRTPMNAVLGISEIQLQNEALEPDVRDGLEKIYASGYMLLGIINDILDMSKIEAGKLELTIANYETASVISDTAQFNMMRIGCKPIEFELVADENLPVALSGDELRIKQIINNLLSNAIKYTEKGKVKMSISAEPADDKNDEVILVINVSDTGQGMTKEQVSKLFDAYARFNLKTNRTTEGTGLGMSITRNLIHMMNGQIHVDSEPGKGSVFIVRLPQGMVNSEVLGKEMADNLNTFKTSSRAQERRGQITREPMPYGRVLIVDDVETNIYVVKGLMTPYQLNIDSASSGFAAIEKIKNGKRYDIIFMDHMMPEMDGIEATSCLRDLGYADPIVALTANAVVGQADMFLHNGFDDFMSKPIDIRQLNTVLNKFVRDKQAPEVIEAVRSQEGGEEAVQTKTRIKNRNIDGLDIARGLERYDGNEEIYLNILRSYAGSVDSMLGSIETVNGEELVSYKIKVHGIKGASYDIFANQIGKEAEALEHAANAGDVDFINGHNPAFLEATRKFISDIEDVLSAINAENPKPQKDKPDNKLLLELLAACQDYSMSGVDEAMEEIEKYQYGADGGLTDWLRKNVDIMNFKQIVEKLSNLDPSEFESK